MSRPTAAQRGYDTRWTRTRRRYLRQHLLCMWPGGCGEEAVDVHHVDGRGPLGPRGHDPANLMALCKSHHSQITNADRPKRERPASTHPGAA
jgi:5-methylcytosine-specific restriction protein A